MVQHDLDEGNGMRVEVAHLDCRFKENKNSPGKARLRDSKNFYDYTSVTDLNELCETSSSTCQTVFGQLLSRLFLP